MQNSKYKFDFFNGLLLFIALFIGSSLAYAVGLGLSALLGEDISKTGGFNIFSFAITMLMPILFFDVFVARKEKIKLNFNFSTKPLRVYLLLFPMMFGMMLIVDYTTKIIPTTGPIFGPLYETYMEAFETMFEDSVATIIMTVILAPILEEILFRGIIMKGMINNGVDPTKAIVISALIFGFIHFNPWQFVGASLIGMVLGLVYYKTKSLLMPILLHAFNNLIAALLEMFTDSDSFYEFFDVSKEITLVVGIIIFAIPFCFFVIHKNKIQKN